MTALLGNTDEQIRKFKVEFSEIAKRILCVLANDAYFWPLVISNCNGTGSWSFSDATIEYSFGEQYFPAFMWYTSVFKLIGQELSQTDTTDSHDFKRKQMVIKLMHEVTNIPCKHGKCLKQLIEDKQKLDEERVKCVLAIHYFKPLSNDGVCVVDNCRESKCPFCYENITVNQEETSFGNTLVWHGESDILVKKSRVKVEFEHVDGEIYQQDEDGEDNETLDWSKIDKSKTENPISISQAIAQTIVNAFVESNIDQSLNEKFIASFLTSEKQIRIILYNCKLDTLLISDKLPIWENNCSSLCKETMIFVWLALNHFVCIEDNTTKRLLAKTPKSNFKNVVGKAYEIYLKDVTRPCKKSESTLNSQRLPVDVDDMEFIHKTRIELALLLTA